MSKVILFDWGGVVETSNIVYDMMRDIMYSLGFTNVDEGLIYEKFHKGTGTSYFDGITNEEEFDIALREYLLNFSGDIPITQELLEEYKRLYVDLSIDNPFYHDVSEFAYSLKDRCEIGMLSNVQMLDKKRQNKHFNYDKFDHLFLSCELGLTKPNQDIYDYVQEKLGDKEILFLDDNLHNLEIPEKMGWKVYHVQKGNDIEGIKNACLEFLGE